MKLSQRILRMEESATLKMAQMARDLQAKGHQVINLSLGEPDFDTPEHIKQAAKDALDAGITKYTPVAGPLDLRQAICTKLQRDNGLNFNPKQIVMSNGAKQCVANLSMALLDEGDEVIIFAPYWVSYKEIIRLSGATPVFITAGIEQEFKVSADQLRAAITPRTRMVLFSSPCNPTGSVFSRAELHELAKVLANYPDIIVVSDEIYEYINFTEEGHTSIAVFPEVADRTVVINGFSKGYSMTGWRLGYIAAPEWIAEACTKMQGQFTSGASSFGQKAAVTALLSEKSAETSRTMCQAFHQRRDLMLQLLSEINGFKVNNPQGAFYVFPNISAFFGKSHNGQTINTAQDFCEYILNEGHVAIVEGGAFGDPDCVRFSYAASEENLREAVRRIKAAVALLS